MGKTVRDFDPEDQQGALDAIDSECDINTLQLSISRLSWSFGG
jgi:hypothetical protein